MNGRSVVKPPRLQEESPGVQPQVPLVKRQGGGGARTRDQVGAVAQGEAVAVAATEGFEAVRLEAGEDMAAVGCEHAVAVALQPERGGSGAADHAVGFEAYVGSGELGVGSLRKQDTCYDDGSEE